MPRVITYVLCRLVEIDQAGTGKTVDDFWVECTVEGSALVEKIKADRLAASQATGLPTKTSATAYHVYYADGGHGRFIQRTYLLEEAKLFPSTPTTTPELLLPTPEWVHMPGTNTDPVEVFRPNWNTGSIAT